MSVGYIVRRFLIFLVVVWAAATFNFLLPRLAGLALLPFGFEVVDAATAQGTVVAVPQLRPAVPGDGAGTG